MRRVLHGDVATAARVLYARPATERQALITALIAGADVAHAHARATGGAHPVWGTGSLMSAATSHRRGAEPDFDDDEYCQCWVMVLLALVERRARTA